MTCPIPHVLGHCDAETDFLPQAYDDISCSFFKLPHFQIASDSDNFTHDGIYLKIRLYHMLFMVMEEAVSTVMGSLVYLSLW